MRARRNMLNKERRRRAVGILERNTLRLTLPPRKKTNNGEDGVWRNELREVKEEI